MTTALSRIRILTAAAAVGLFGAASAPAFADDGFVKIYMSNQKIGSEVSAYWLSQLPQSTTTMDAFAAIHAENQKIGSAVWAHWLSQRTLAHARGAIAVLQ